MGVWKSIANAIEREYDRRTKRASLVTEYGIHHHADHAEDAHDEEAHDEDTHAAEAHVVDEHVTDETEEEAEIVNVPRGTPVAMDAPTPDNPPAPAEPEPATPADEPRTEDRG